MTGAAVCMALLVAGMGGPPWKAPAHPDPHQILSEAQEDTRQGRYSVALAKHLWFHREALKVDQSFYGVRLSFALDYWKDLAQRYPPAMEALVKTRDDALKSVLEGGGAIDAFNAFHDLVALNRALGESGQTVRTFVRLDAERPELAERVFNLAQPALIRAKEYAVCGKYLKPRRSWLMARQIYEMDKLRAEENGGRPEYEDFREKSFTNEVSTLVALLVVNGREDEARALAEEAKRFREDQDFHAAIDAALNGTVPEPWP